MSKSPCTHARTLRLAVALAVALAGVAATGIAFADAADAHIPPPVDTPYPGTITLNVNATNTAQGIFTIHETIPVTAGELTLLYPKWIPGNHAPDPDTLEKVAGLVITANGRPLKWLRDKYDVYAFHVDVPAGVSSIDVQFQYLSARAKDEGPIMTDTMVDLSWNQVSLYPAGHYSRDITVAPSVTLPAGWQFGTALERVDQSRASKTGNTTTFKPTTYNTLVDSPIYAGLHFKRADLDPGAKVPVHLDIVADSPTDLVITPAELKVHRALVTQAYKLFDSHHYDHYDFLFSVSDHLAENGLEHHQSSEDGASADYFTKWKDGALDRDLLAHEYTHSWNGKFRRPADLWTPSFNVPMGDSLLWVYEGQTQYWGYVLTARAGLWTPAQFREALAMVAAEYNRNRPGFTWRDIRDTTNDEVIQHRRPLAYRNWQLSEEYYSGGQMAWLAVDTKIRQLTHDRKSLDTFAKDFFGVDSGSFVTETYTFDDVVAALNGVVQYDWADFLDKYINSLNPPLLAGLDASGWKLVYTDKPNALLEQAMKKYHIGGFEYSIGLSPGKQGVIKDVRWNGPAFKAGVGSGATLVAVNGEAYSSDVLHAAIVDAQTSRTPIQLLLKYQDRYKTVSVAYYDGPQYPHLERVRGTPDYLDQIIAAK